MGTVINPRRIRSSDVASSSGGARRKPMMRPAVPEHGNQVDRDHLAGVRAHR